MRANWIRRVSTVVVVGVIGGAVSGVLAGPETIVEPRPMLVIGPDPMLVIGPDPMIVVGPGGAAENYELLADTPGQWIEILVSGGGQVAGCNFNAQIGDGGPALGGTLGPIITSVDLEGSSANPTIFFGNCEPQNNLDVVGIPQLAMYSIITNSGTVLADGVLVRLEIDTTDFSGDRTWTLALGATLNSPTDFAPMSVTIIDGGIHIPEPASLALLLCGGLAIIRKRKRSAGRMSRRNPRASL